MATRKHGIVYIADLGEDGWPKDSGGRYVGHWDDGREPAQILEDGPGWDDAEEAISWGRERAPKVFVRVGPQVYSAGDEDPEDESVVRWESR
jgi:hypothetical protein